MVPRADEEPADGFVFGSVQWPRTLYMVQCACCQGHKAVIGLFSLVSFKCSSSGPFIRQGVVPFLLCAGL